MLVSLYIVIYSIYYSSTYTGENLKGKRGLEANLILPGIYMVYKLNKNPKMKKKKAKALYNYHYDKIIIIALRQ